MDATALGLILGLTGAIPVLENIKKYLKKSLQDHDEYYSQLEKISKRVLTKHSLLHVNLGQKVEILNSIEKGLLTGEIDNLNENICELLNITTAKLSQITTDFRTEIINTGSKELNTAMLLKVLDNDAVISDKLDKLINDLNSTQETSKFEETKQIVLEYLIKLILEGKLKTALYSIERINLDNYRDEDFDRQIIILESKIVLKAGLVDKISVQTIKLTKISENNERNKLLYLLEKRLKPDDFDYEGFLTKYKITNHEHFLNYYHDIISNELTEVSPQLDHFEFEQQRSALRQILINCINKNKPQNAKALNQKYSDILTDNQSQFYLLLNRFNEFQMENRNSELTLKSQEKLRSLGSELQKLEPFFSEYSKNFLASFYYNYCITLCRLRDESWKKYFEYFKDDEKLVVNFITFAEVSSFSEDVIKIFNKYDLVQNPTLREHYLDLKFKIGDLDYLSQIDISSVGNKDLQSKILVAKNLMKYKELEEEFSENDLIFFESETENLRIYIFSANIFLAKGDNQLARKFALRVFKKKCHIGDADSYLLSDILFRLNLPRIAKALCKQLFETFPQSQILYCRILQKISNNYELPNLEANAFFQQLDIINASPSLIRLKIEYLSRRNESDKALKISEYLVENYNIPFDWLNHSLLLLQSGKTSAAKSLVPQLEQLNTSETHIAIGFIHLYTQTRNESKLEGFGTYFFRASKLLFKDGYILDARLFQPAWYYVLSNNIYDNKEFEYVDKDTHVILRNLVNESTLEICVHSNDELVDNENSYLNCKHYHFQDEFIQSSLYLKRPTKYIFDDETKERLIGKGITRKILTNLESIKGKVYYGKHNIHKQLESILKFGDETKLITVIIGELTKKHDEIIIGEDRYAIEDIFSIWNLPFRRLVSTYYSNPEEYGLKLIEINKDPVTTIIPELADSKIDREKRISDYSQHNIPFHVMSGRNYDKYSAAMLALVDSNIYNAGFALNFDSEEKVVFSFTSLVFLFLFLKIEHMETDNIVITNTTYDKISQINTEQVESINQEKMSLFLDTDLRPSRLSLNADENRTFAENWLRLKNVAEKAEKVDTTSIEDIFTLFTNFLGKLEIDSLRAAQKLKLPLIIDDEYFQHAVRYPLCTNSISYYFEFSNESTREKMAFLHYLSKSGYRYILYPGFLAICFSRFLEESLVLGSDSAFDLFLKLVKTELYKPYRHMKIEYEILNAFRVLTENYLHQNSDLLISGFISIVPDIMKDWLRFNVLFHFCHTVSQKKYFRELFKQN